MMTENQNPASYKSLLQQFESTKKELGDAEESIRRITGRDPDNFSKDGKKNQSGLPKWKTQPGAATGKEPFVGRNKRPLFPIVKDKESVPQEEDSSEEDEPAVKKPSLQSTVVATPKDLKSRKETIQEQNVNSKVKARNRRMFGMILGTLQKFQHDAKKREEKDLIRAKIEQKVEDAAAEEKERIKKEKEELFQTRREKQAQLRCLEKKIEIAELHEVWENSQKHMINYLVTTSQPPIYFLPATHTSKTLKLLEESKKRTLEVIRERREKLEKDLLEVEEWYKKDNFPSDKENIGPSEDDVLTELVDNREMQTTSEPSSDTHPKSSDTPEHQETLQEPEDTPQETQSNSEISESTQNPAVDKTENNNNNDEMSDPSNEENATQPQTDQDFEPIYD